MPVSISGNSRASVPGVRARLTQSRAARGISTLWVAEVDGRFYAVTKGTSAKMKRLRTTDRIRLAACDARGNVRGEWVEGRAKRVEDPLMMDRALAALARKYGWLLAAAPMLTLKRPHPPADLLGSQTVMKKVLLVCTGNMNRKLLC